MEVGYILVLDIATVVLDSQVVWGMSAVREYGEASVVQGTGEVAVPRRCCPC